MTTKKSLEQIDAQLEQLQIEREKVLTEQRDEDLETVKRLIKSHGFTRTQLRTAFTTKARGKKSAAAKKKLKPAKKDA